MIDCNCSQIFYYKNPDTGTLCLAYILDSKSNVYPINSICLKDQNLNILDIDVENMFGTNICQIFVGDRTVAFLLNDGRVYYYYGLKHGFYLPIAAHIVKIIDIFDEIRFTGLFLLTDNGEIILYNLRNETIMKNPYLHNVSIKNFDLYELAITKRCRILRIRLDDFVDNTSFNGTGELSEITTQSDGDHCYEPTWSQNKTFTGGQGLHGSAILLLDDKYFMYRLNDPKANDS